MNDYRAYIETNYNAIYHHGIKGQRWGLRRYQNPDGSLTPEGKRRYLNPDGSLNDIGRKELGKKYLKDQSKMRYAIGGAAGIGGSIYAAKTAKKIGDNRRYGSKVVDKISEINKQHPEEQFYKSGTFVKGNDSVLNQDIRMPKTSNDVTRLEKAGYYLTDSKGKYGKGTYVKDFRNVRDMPGKLNNPLWDIDSKRVYDKSVIAKSAEEAKKLQNEGYRIVPNRPFDIGYKANPIAQQKIADLEKSISKSSKRIAIGVLAAGLGATAIGLYLHHKKTERGKAEVEKLLMTHDSSDSSVTKKVKDDFNKLSNKEFEAKYKTSKDTYAKRVAKYGDPYMNSPWAKWAKAQNAKKQSEINKINKQRKEAERNAKKELDAINKSNLSEEDKAKRRRRLELDMPQAYKFLNAKEADVRKIPREKNSNAIVQSYNTFSKANNRAQSLGSNYYVAYDESSGEYVVRKKVR